EDQLKTETSVEFDDATGKVCARRRVAFDDLILEEGPAPLPSGDEVAAALAKAAPDHLEPAFPIDDTTVPGFRIPVQCLANWRPELNLPPLNDAALRGLLPQLCAGRRSLGELQNAPWLDAMRSLFSWQQLQAIDREAPTQIEVPSGSRIALLY